MPVVGPALRRAAQPALSSVPVVAVLVPLEAWAQSSAAWGAASSWAVPFVPSRYSPARASGAAEEADPSQSCELEGMAS